MGEKRVNRLRELELLATQAANSARQASEDRSGNHDLWKLSEGYQTSRDDISLQNSTRDWIGSSLSLSSFESGLEISASTEDILPQISFNDIPEVSFELPDANTTFPQTELLPEITLEAFQRDDILQTPSLVFSSTSESRINPIELNSTSLDVTLEIPEIPYSSAGKDAYNPTQSAAYHDEPSPNSISSIQLVRRIGTRGDPNLVKKKNTLEA